MLLQYTLMTQDTLELGAILPSGGLNAAAMQQGGITAVEVVLRTSAALDAISAIRQHCPQLLVGAGTVLSQADAQNCKNAGAQFLVSPASTPALLQAMSSRP